MGATKCVLRDSHMQIFSSFLLFYTYELRFFDLLCDCFLHRYFGIAMSAVKVLISLVRV